MSEAVQGYSNAKDIKWRAAEWLMERRFGENWSDQDEARLRDWLSQSLAHRIAFVRLEAAWARTDRLAALRPQKTPLRRSIRPLLARVAATLGAVAVVGGIVGTVMLTPREKIYVTAIGGRETVDLGDGSRVELNTDTRLRVGAQGRKVVLEKGEAFFQIRHDASRSFVVLAGDHRVVDIGTKFAVRADSGRLEVSLVEGKARLESADAWIQPHAALLGPGDVAVATTNSLSVKHAPEKSILNALSWRTGLLVFDHATLATVVAEFNRYNQIKLVIGDAAAARMAIYGTFRADNVRDFVVLARNIFGLRTVQRNGEIVILR